MTMKKVISLLADSILAGVMIGIAATVSLSCDNRYIGSLLFGFGLFCIIFFKFGLYTGKVGYIPSNKPVFLIELLFTLLGNAAGTFFSAMLIRCTRIAPPIIEKAAEMMNTKAFDTPLSMLILSFFCGILMFAAVHGFRLCKSENNSTASVVVVFWAIMVFIISGFNHCIADMFYFFLSGMRNAGAAALYFPVIIIGNSLGGVFIPLIKKLSENKVD